MIAHRVRKLLVGLRITITYVKWGCAKQNRQQQPPIFIDDVRLSIVAETSFLWTRMIHPAANKIIRLGPSRDTSRGHGTEDERRVKKMQFLGVQGTSSDGEPLVLGTVLGNGYHLKSPANERAQ